jgi:hypothetical protein
MMYGKNLGSFKTCERIPEGSVGVEIGVWRGDSSEKFLSRVEHLHLVDSWSPIPYQDSTEHGDYENYLKRYEELVGSRNPDDYQKFYDKIYNSVCERFKDKPVTIHRMNSREFFPQFTEKVDWVYVDGDHSYAGVTHDLTNALTIIKEGGKILGDDYAAVPPKEGGFKPDVKRAVDDFVKNNNLKFTNFYGTQYEITK